MKKFFVISFICLCSFAKAQTPHEGTLTLVVNIKKFKSDAGMAYISLQDPNKKAVQQQTIKVEKKTAQVVFKNLPVGKYAVRLFHDENDNKKLDTGFFGIPKEGWGVSNDVKARFGPPKYEDTIFALDQDKTISITMN